MRGPDLSRPSEALELLDGDGSDAEIRAAHEDIALSNRLLGATRVVVAALSDLLRRAALDGRGPVTLLDAGTGGGDVPAAVLAWARARRLDVHVIALDAAPAAARLARERLRGERGARVVLADVRALPLRDGAADVVHAGMLLHHVPRPDQPAVLARLGRAGRVGAVVSDVVRAPAAYHGVRLFGALTGRRRYFRHDAPLSVARGFTLEEARALATASGLPGVRVRAWMPWRLTWTMGPWPSVEERGP